MFKYYEKCSPQCEYFRCGQHTLRRSGKGVYCEWADDLCTGGLCNYAICVRGKLLSNGKCAMAIRRKTRADAGPEAMEAPKIRVRGKALRRLGREEIF